MDKSLSIDTGHHEKLYSGKNELFADGRKG